MKTLKHILKKFLFKNIWKMKIVEFLLKMLQKRDKVFDEVDVKFKLIDESKTINQQNVQT